MVNKTDSWPSDASATERQAAVAEAEGVAGKNAKKSEMTEVAKMVEMDAETPAAAGEEQEPKVVSTCECAPVAKAKLERPEEKDEPMEAAAVTAEAMGGEVAPQAQRTLPTPPAAAKPYSACSSSSAAPALTRVLPPAVVKRNTLLEGNLTHPGLKFICRGRYRRGELVFVRRELNVRLPGVHLCVCVLVCTCIRMDTHLGVAHLHKSLQDFSSSSSSKLSPYACKRHSLTSLRIW
jgi:hypothetical protein